MARYGTIGLSQATQLSGVNAGTTVNGYMGYWGASATSGFRLRRLTAGVRIAAGGVPVSQQVSIGVYRQTVAPSGTGLAAAILGIPFEPWTPQTDPTVGLIMTTAATIGTTAPTIGANALASPTFNTQSGVDKPWEFTEEIICNLGTANGIAFVILGGTLPASHLVVLDIEIEV